MFCHGILRCPASYLLLGDSLWEIVLTARILRQYPVAISIGLPHIAII